MVKTLTITITVAVACIMGLTACVTPDYKGQTVVRRESIKISSGVARLVENSDEPVVLEEDKRIMCSRTLVTGSHIPFTYCRTRDEYEDAIRYGQDILRNEQGVGVR